jgi:hypothetical protein
LKKVAKKEQKAAISAALIIVFDQTSKTTNCDLWGS